MLSFHRPFCTSLISNQGRSHALRDLHICTCKWWVGSKTLYKVFFAHCSASCFLASSQTRSFEETPTWYCGLLAPDLCVQASSAMLCPPSSHQPHPFLRVHSLFSSTDLSQRWQLVSEGLKSATALLGHLGQVTSFLYSTVTHWLLTVCQVCCLQAEAAGMDLKKKKKTTKDTTLTSWNLHSIYWSNRIYWSLKDWTFNALIDKIIMVTASHRLPSFFFFKTCMNVCNSAL